MSHLERLLSLLEDIGLHQEDHEDDIRNPWAENPRHGFSLTQENDGTRIAIGAGKDGYSGFYCSFTFDKDGRYVSHACAE